MSMSWRSSVMASDTVKSKTSSAESRALKMWTSVTMIISYSIGTGVLALPYSVAALGWQPFVGIFLATLIGWCFSSYLYIGLHAAVPSAHNFAELASVAYGFPGWLAATLCQNGFMLMFSIVFHLTATKSVMVIMGEENSDKMLRWCSSVGLLLVILLQVQNLKWVGAMSIVGSFTIIMPCMLVVLYFVVQGPLEGATTSMFASPSPAQLGMAVSNFVFAFAGQHIWIELQSNCEDSTRKFPRAVSRATVCVVILYSVVGAVGYSHVGEKALSSGDPVTLFVCDSICRTIVNFMVLVHVIIGYVENSNLLIKNMLGSMLSMRPLFNDEELQQSWKHHTSPIIEFSFLHWCSATVVCVSFTLAVAVAVPFFGDLCSISCALCLVSLTYTFPLALALKLQPLTRLRYRIYVGLVVFSIFCTVVLTAACVANIEARY